MELAARMCDSCGKQFMPKRRNQRFCQASCRSAHRYVATPLPSSRTCACGTEFKPKKRDHIYCSRECSTRELRAYYMADPNYRAEYKAALADWRRANPESQAKYNKESRYRKKFGIELADFLALVESQDSCCEICGTVSALVPDHDHITGQFRGAICGDCNSGLGFFADASESLVAAAAYLIRHGESSDSTALNTEGKTHHA